MLHFAVSFGESVNLEKPRSCKLADQLSARGRPVLVVNHGRNMIHVQAERVSIEQQHHERHRQRHPQAQRIPRDVVQLFDEHRPQPPQAHAAFLSSASIIATNTSSIEGSICSSFFTSIFFAASAFRIESSPPSTVTCKPAPNTATS